MFATRFWSPGYSSGLDTLFAKLHQGVNENNEFLALAQARAEAEDAHGAKLQAVAATLQPKRTGFARDDGATMRRAYEGILGQMADEARHHAHIADSIRGMVVRPFTAWAAQHKVRIEKSQNELKRLVKAYDHELEAVHRAQHRYFNRCRLEEDSGEKGDDSSASIGDSVLKNEIKESTNSDSDRSSVDGVSRSRVASGASAASTAPTEQLESISVAKESTSEELVLAGHHYSADESQHLIGRMLNELGLQPTRVPILGTYEHTCTGAAISDWIRENTPSESVEQVEQAGQMLVNTGLIRLIGQVGSRFVNSSVFVYQWKPRAWEFAGISLAATETGKSAQALYHDWAKRWTARTDPSAQSVKELDQKYKKAVAILDSARLDLEANMFELLEYLERCERERLVAFKAVLLDFAAAVSNIVPALSASVDQLLLYHETADVDRDLRFLVENYQSGHYNPNVVVYDNYYSSADGAAVFGLDVDLRARADKKRVPVIVSAALSSMDAAYPPMENDAQRLQVWQIPINKHLRDAQEARQQINAAASSPHHIREVFSKLPPFVVVQVLKLYLLELPISLISGQLYDILKGVYAKFNGSEEEHVQARVQSLQNALAQLTLSHIATLDALTAHIHRLVTISNASETDIDHIAKEWGPTLCWPKVPSALSLDDVFTVQIFKDLLGARDRVFGELKKYAMLSPQPSTSSDSSRFRSLSQRARATSLKQQARSSQHASPNSSSASLVSSDVHNSSSDQPAAASPSLASQATNQKRASSHGSVAGSEQFTQEQPFKEQSFKEQPPHEASDRGLSFHEASNEGRSSQSSGEERI